MAWLARICLQDMDAEAEAEMTRCLLQLRDRHPQWVNSMRELSRVELRQYARANDFSMAAFQQQELGIVAMPAELLAVPQRYGEKLGKALYYKHSGRILPQGGGVSVLVFPNTSYMSKSFPLKRFQILTSIPVVTRGGRSLQDQFTYRYVHLPDERVAAFAVQFGESTAMLLVVAEDEAELRSRLAATKLGDIGLPPNEEV